MPRAQDIDLSVRGSALAGPFASLDDAVARARQLSAPETAMAVIGPRSGAASVFEVRDRDQAFSLHEVEKRGFRFLSGLESGVDGGRPIELQAYAIVDRERTVWNQEALAAAFGPRQERGAPALESLDLGAARAGFGRSKESLAGLVDGRDSNGNRLYDGADEAGGGSAGAISASAEPSPLPALGGAGSYAARLQRPVPAPEKPEGAGPSFLSTLRKRIGLALAGLAGTIGALALGGSFVWPIALPFSIALGRAAGWATGSAAAGWAAGVLTWLFSGLPLASANGPGKHSLITGVWEWVGKKWKEAGER
ncbi:MAG: hypothetical protein HY554_04585 [Elusimicrobia bacterium]|nr:hypothetical protein [Elusimicrobiota bacterium]